MPTPSPFHPRTSALCSSLFWKEWAGYHAVRSYDTCHEREYYALRHAAAMIDVTPLFKYEVRGPDAARFLSRVTVKNVARMRHGRVSYLCWCDDAGQLIDDGTVSRLGEEHFRLTAAEPSLAWLSRFAGPYDVTIEDSSARIAAVAIQGPNSRAVLARAAEADVEGLKFFRVTTGSIAGKPAWISRTGYTGDLGYEVWCAAEDALVVWDAIFAAGREYRLAPMGLDALDVSRVEAGFIMNGVDYFSAHHCLIDARKSSPFEAGLGWTVQLDRDDFVGRNALVEEKRRGSDWSFVGLEMDWDEYEKLFAGFGLPPHVPSGAWRDAVPLYGGDGKQVGYATSGAWSPMLKRNLALATVRAAQGRIGTRLQMEVTAEFERRRVTATVVKTPFYDPPRKRG